MFYITTISVIIAILSLRYALRLRTYLKDFMNISQKISNKEFHARMDESTKGELGELSRNFNSMIRIMDSTIQELEDSHLKMESILKSIPHGILAIDINSNIILINEEAKNMLKCDSDIKIEGSNINAVINEKLILREIMYFMGSKISKNKEIKINDDLVYLINLDPIYLQGSNKIIIGAIINIKNITERVRLENMRSDFVANVSHELKTPLTSISGFVETLRLNENIDVNTRNRFLGIIESESNRLKRLIEDILLLSFIEGKDHIAKEIVFIDEVFSEVKEITQSLAKAKDLVIHYEIQNKYLRVMANRDYMKQVMLNLMDNAIKYSNSASDIYVSIGNKDDKVIISVKDEGVGIPEEDLSRVFERFYRVDKARSRDVGGTGLGLAITKHIVKHMDGNIEVKSELGKGSEFIVSLPQKNFLK